MWALSNEPVVLGAPSLVLILNTTVNQWVTGIRIAKALGKLWRDDLFCNFFFRSFGCACAWVFLTFLLILLIFCFTEKVQVPSTVFTRG